MSTAADATPVKRALLDALRHELLPALEQLIDQLPSGLADADRAERQVRAGLLAVARLLLQAWAQAADTAAQRPNCPAYRGSFSLRCLPRRGSKIDLVMT